MQNRVSAIILLPIKIYNFFQVCGVKGKLIGTGVLTSDVIEYNITQIAKICSVFGVQKCESLETYLQVKTSR